MRLFVTSLELIYFSFARCIPRGNGLENKYYKVVLYTRGYITLLVEFLSNKNTNNLSFYYFQNYLLLEYPYYHLHDYFT